MNKITTPSKSVNAKQKEVNAKTPKVSEKTLNFLRAFASNYRVEHELPQGLQGIILG